MGNINKALRLRIYIGSTDKLKSSLLFESIVYQAKRYGLGGATVYKGIMGYGASSVIHSYKFWEISEKVPVTVEIIDEGKKIRDFFDIIKPYLENMQYGCMVTLEPIEVLLYKSGKQKI